MKKCPLKKADLNNRDHCEEKYCEWWDDDQCVVHHIKKWLKDIAMSAKRKEFIG